jgi:hypothetical protein
MPPDPLESRKFNTVEAAAHLGLGQSTLAKLRVFGGGPPFYKLGRRVVYDHRDLDNWVAERRRVSTSDPGRELLDIQARKPRRCR